MKKIIHNSSGFTILEVLIAVVILTVGLIGTAGLLMGVIRTNHLSNEMARATALAQSSMERLRQVGYIGALEAGQSVTETITQDSEIPEGFSRTTEVFSTGTTGAKGVRVTVTFPSFGLHTVELKTIIAR